MLQLEVIGNLGNDAEIKEFGGTKYVSMNVAHSERRKDGANATVWVGVLWHGEGGNLLQYLKKGTKIFARGRFVPKIYTDQQGQPQYAVNMYASEVTFCGSRNDTAAPPSQSATAPQPVAQPQAKRYDDYSDNLPF